MDDAGCPCCGLDAETALHRWPRCPAREGTRHQAQVSDLAGIGAVLEYRPRCFWQNGVVPEASVALAASEPMLRQEGPVHDCVHGLVGGGVVDAWTEGAASHPSVPQLRRAGWGLWIPGPAGCSLAEPVCGRVQTAQRAEVCAFVVALECTARDVNVWTDSRFVCRPRHPVPGRSGVPPLGPPRSVGPGPEGVAAEDLVGGLNEGPPAMGGCAGAWHPQACLGGQPPGG